jgi:hypothetical protein
MRTQGFVYRLVILSLSLSLGVGCASSPDKPDERGLATGPETELSGRPATGGGGAQAGEQVKQFDLNHDNQPDVWAYYGPMEDPDAPGQTHEALIRKEWDFNFDGKVDIRRYFNFRGETVKDELDLDFDGRFDVTTYYQAGSKVRQEYDFNFDKQPDYWKFYEKNVIVRSERDRDFNGRVDRWEYFAEGKLDRVGLDEDGDGQIDKWLQEERPE